MHLIQEEIGLPQIKKDSGDDTTQCVFSVSPLPQGYGTTLGNAFRRVLLSSLPGAAITGIKVKGKNYEYSTIEGAKDSILDMMLNLKQIQIKKTSTEPSVVKLSATKAGEVTAGMIDAPSDIEIINPDHVITTLEKSSTLEMEIRIEKNVGYTPASQKKDEEELADWIWMDAFFSPVKKVRFETENTRVGQMTNLDKLVLDIETNGSITPDDAIKFSANLLQSYFSLFNAENLEVEADFISDMESIAKKQHEEESTKPNKESYTPIEILGLSPRTLNALINGEIGSIEQLTKCTESKLTNLRGFGKKALTEVAEALEPRGLSLADE
jgi:DNA-directed RNA polymerase subunit alpha